MLITMWANAVMCRVNVQNVLRRLQRRLSVACAIHWWHCQSLPGLDSSIPPQHAGSSSTSVIRWCLYCTHALVGFPKPRSGRGSDPDKTRFWMSLITARPTATRTTLDAAGSVNMGRQHYSVLRPTRSTQPCIPPGSLNRVPASASVKAGMLPLPGGR